MINEDLSRHLPGNERAPNLYIFVAPKAPPPLPIASGPSAPIASPDTNLQSANARAAAIDRAIAPRRVSPEQREKIAQALREKITLAVEQTSRGKIRRNESEEILINVSVVCEDDPETRLFGEEICDAFRAARAKNVARSIRSSTLGDAPFGLFIVGNSENVAREVLSDAGIVVTRDDAWEARLRNGVQPGMLRVFVGHKPP
jgi:hypothetical protein